MRKLELLERCLTIQLWISALLSIKGKKGRCLVNLIIIKEIEKLPI